MSFFHPFTLTAYFIDGVLAIGCGSVASWLCIQLCW